MSLIIGFSEKNDHFFNIITRVLKHYNPYLRIAYLDFEQVKEEKRNPNNIIITSVSNINWNCRWIKSRYGLVFKIGDSDCDFNFDYHIPEIINPDLMSSVEEIEKQYSDFFDFLDDFLHCNTIF